MKFPAASNVPIFPRTNDGDESSGVDKGVEIPIDVAPLPDAIFSNPVINEDIGVDATDGTLTATLGEAVVS